MTPRSKVRRRLAPLSGEQGFTIVEGLIAAVMLMLTSLAIFAGYDAGNRSTFKAQQRQVALSVAQQELESARAMDYESVALTAQPDHDANPANPDYRVLGGNFNLNRTGTPDYAPLVVKGGTKIGGGVVQKGSIDPQSSFQNGTVKGQIYRFVVWRSDNGCPSPTCTGQDIRRLIVIVAPDSTTQTGASNYIELHSDFTDPTTTATSDIPAGGGPVVTAQQFWLSDTPCAATPPTNHVDISAHALHNTFGACGDGAKSGATAGAPDTLMTFQPPGQQTDPYFDYQNDSSSTLKTGDSAESGIQLAPQSQSSPTCSFGASGNTNPQQRFHVWLSDPIDPGFGNFIIDGPVTFTFFSRTLRTATSPNPNTYPGSLCIWLFRRTPGNADKFFGSGASMTTPSWICTVECNTDNGNWPRDYGDLTDEPPNPMITSATLTDSGGDLKITPNSRLGLAIAVPKTTAGPLEFMYDHPLFPSRLQVDTTTPLG